MIYINIDQNFPNWLTKWVTTQLLVGHRPTEAMMLQGKMVDDPVVTSGICMCTHPHHRPQGAAFPKVCVTQLGHGMWVGKHGTTRQVIGTWFEICGVTWGIHAHDPEATTELSAILPCSILTSSGPHQIHHGQHNGPPRYPTGIWEPRYRWLQCFLL